jgi:hypothetical protein
VAAFQLGGDWLNKTEGTQTEADCKKRSFVTAITSRAQDIS